MRNLGLSISRTIGGDNLNKVRLAGGLDKSIFDCSFEDQRAFLEKIVYIGRPGRGFIVMDAGRALDKVTSEQWPRFLELGRELME